MHFHCCKIGPFVGHHLYIIQFVSLFSREGESKCNANFMILERIPNTMYSCYIISIRPNKFDMLNKYFESDLFFALNFLYPFYIFLQI